MRVFLLLGTIVFFGNLFVRTFERQNQVTSLPADSDRWALLVGIGKYDDESLSTLYGPGDVKDLASDLRKYAHFPEDQIIVLSDEATDPKKKPTKQNITWWLSNVKTNSSPQSLLLFAFSGHGVSVKDQTYLLARDTNLSSDADYLKEGAISSDYIAESLRHSMAKQVILLLDACRDQAVAKGEGAQNPLTQGFVDSFDLAKRNLGKEAYLTFYATHVGQEAFQNDAEKRSYFSLVLHKAFQGEPSADGRRPYNDEGVMTLATLIDYVSERTHRLVKLDHPDKNQVPYVMEEGYLNSQVALAERPELRLKKEPKEAIRATIPNKDADLLSQAFLLRATNPMKALDVFIKQSTPTARAAYGPKRWLSDLWSLILAARLREMPISLSANIVSKLSQPLITSDGRYLIGCGRQGGLNIELFALDRLQRGKTADLRVPIPEPDFNSCLVIESELPGFATVNVKVTGQMYRSYLFDLRNDTPRLSTSAEDFSAFDGKTLITVSKLTVTWKDFASGRVTKNADLPKVRGAVSNYAMPPRNTHYGVITDFHLGPSVDARCYQTCEVYVVPTQTSHESVRTELKTDPSGVTLWSFDISAARVLGYASVSDAPIATRQLGDGQAMIVTKGGKVFRWSTTFFQRCCEVPHSDLEFISVLASGSRAKDSLAVEGTTAKSEPKIILFRQKLEEGSQKVSSYSGAWQKLSISPAGNWLIAALGDHKVLVFASSRLGKEEPTLVRCDPPIETDPEDKILACVDPDSGKVVLRQLKDLQNIKALDLAYSPSELSFMGGRLYALTLHAESQLMVVASADDRDGKLEGQCHADVGDLSRATVAFIPSKKVVIIRPPSQIEFRSVSSCDLEKTLAVQTPDFSQGSRFVGNNILWKGGARGPEINVLGLLDAVDHPDVLPLTLDGLPSFDQFTLSADSKFAIITERNHIYQIPITEPGLLNLATEVLGLKTSQN